MEKDELDKLLYDIFDKEIMPSPELVADTKGRLHIQMILHYALGASILLNVLTFIGMLLFIALAPQGIMMKITVYIIVTALTNLLLTVIILFRENVNSVLELL